MIQGAFVQAWAWNEPSEPMSNRQATDTRIRDMARKQWASDDIEIDVNAVVSKSEVDG